MDETAKEILFGQIRTALAAIGGALVTQGVVSSATVNVVLGIVMALVPFAWSAWGHVQAERKAKAREAVAVNVGIKIADATVGVTPLVTALDAPAVIRAIAPILPAGPIEPEPVVPRTENDLASSLDAVALDRRVAEANKDAAIARSTEVQPQKGLP